MTQFTDEDIHDHLSAHRGVRFRAEHLAKLFGGGTAAMRMTLDRLQIKGRIRKASDGKRAFYFVPSDAEVQQESLVRVRPFRPLSASSLPDMDYNARRAGSGDLLKVASKFHD